MLRVITFLVSLLLPTALAAQALDAGLSADAQGEAKVVGESTANATVSASEQVAPVAPEEMPDTLSGRLALGLRRWSAKDLEGALLAFEAAREVEQKDLTILLFIGSIHFQRGDLEATTQAYAAIVSMAMEADAAVKAKALMGMARVAEARSDFDGAKLAWAAYKSFVTTRTRIPSFVDTAEQRLTAIEQKEALDAQYEVVVARLAKEQQELGAVPPAPSKQGTGQEDNKQTP